MPDEPLTGSEAKPASSAIRRTPDGYLEIIEAYDEDDTQMKPPMLPSEPVGPKSVSRFKEKRMLLKQNKAQD